MIVTLTLNPSLDRTVLVDELEPGAVLRTSEPVLEPGGKGVNVTRALTANGHESIAVVGVAGPEGAELTRLLKSASVPCRFVPVSGRTRSNLTICEADGAVTKLNEPGSPLGEADLRAVATAVRSAVREGDWLVVSGSTPPSIEGSDIRSLLRDAVQAGACLAIDSSGYALAASVEVSPRIVKPNRQELSELVGRELGSIAAVVEGAQEIRARGVELVLVSLGAEGAVLVGPDVVLVGESRVPRPVSTVGAGDSFLAGFLSRFSADESDLAGALVEALAWGAAATGLPGSAVPGPEDLDRSIVQLVWQPDLDRPLVAT
ncbi:1-phosphofructokinase family hexose kinase [Homoserinibacter sp. YIM 151385]|uniref:1-phosphofructokinase family hexose kinase n=1 Tax=Homoserinibacter sp. YIM 151385 TaxID=2985506 RepID=UPI0022EFFC6A|nr:1-phosphofructokinase family hexose kinase [Homoserinibacter sp. YIM 151385]WBU38625.1 1-phosphofructokinase family hexose kinase [Homoserinibacter sp. YIM 151385]